MKEFEVEIKKIAENIKESEIFHEDIDSEAIKLLFDLAEAGIKTLNSKGVNSVKLHQLPADLVPLFFHFESGCNGFVITTEKKYTFFMQSTGNNVFVFGKNKRKGPEDAGNDKMQQLFNIEFAENNGDMSFYDSTNKEINAEEIVLLALNWSLN